MKAPFTNPPGSPIRTSLATRLPTLIGRFVRLGFSRPDRSRVLPHAQALALFDSLRDRETLTWLGHMTVLLRVGGCTILTDPWWSAYASPILGVGPALRAASPVERAAS